MSPIVKNLVMMNSVGHLYNMKGLPFNKKPTQILSGFFYIYFFHKVYKKRNPRTCPWVSLRILFLEGVRFYLDNNLIKSSVILVISFLPSTSTGVIPLTIEYLSLPSTSNLETASQIVLLPLYLFI